MNQLIQITTNEQGSLVVSSSDFAAGLDIQHKNLIETIRTHLNVIERDFGRVAFQTEPFQTRGGKQNLSVAYLTEDQALFVGTLSRNSKRVIEFKSTLVRSFAEARKLLRTNEVLPATQDELILMLAQRNVDTAKRVTVLEERFERFERISEQATAELLALPAPTESMPELATETKVVQLVNAYARSKAVVQPEVWRMLYNKLYYHYHVAVNNYKLNPGESKLQMLKRVGHLDKLYVVATNVLQTA